MYELDKLPFPMLDRDFVFAQCWGGALDAIAAGGGGGGGGEGGGAGGGSSPSPEESAAQSIFAAGAGGEGGAREEEEEGREGGEGVALKPLRMVLASVGHAQRPAAETAGFRGRLELLYVLQPVPSKADPAVMHTRFRALTWFDLGGNIPTSFLNALSGEVIETLLAMTGHLAWLESKTGK